MSRFGAGFTSAGVPGNDAFTKILLHMDGSDGGTSFPDVNVGGSSHTWSPTNATTSTASKKFGTAAMLTASGFISTPAHADFNIGTQDFAADFQFNSNGTSGFVGLAGQMDAVGNLASISFAISRLADGRMQAQMVNATVTGIRTLIGTTNFNGLTSFVHCALTKEGTTFRLFADGALEASGTLDSVNASANNFSVGRIGVNGSGSSALFDEFRLSVGTPRWTSNFTPPIGPYT